MATFGEIAYAIQDFSKTISDDVIITPEHIMFLMGRYRNYLLLTAGRRLTQADYQTVCVDLEGGGDDGICGGRPYMASIEEVPQLLERGLVTVQPPAGFMHSYRYQHVGWEKFRFVGHNQYLRSFIYSTIGPDGRLYLTGADSGYMHLEKVRMTAIFEDVEGAAERECDGSCNREVCDIMDRRFPLEGSLVPLLMQYVTKEITGAAWNPRDDENNASDDLSTFAQVLSRYTNTAFKNMMKGGQGDGAQKQ